jgi:hypothetical protein
MHVYCYYQNSSIVCELQWLSEVTAYINWRVMILFSTSKVILS